MTGNLSDTAADADARTGGVGDEAPFFERSWSAALRGVCWNAAFMGVMSVFVVYAGPWFRGTPIEETAGLEFMAVWATGTVIITALDTAARLAPKPIHDYLNRTFGWK